ncbi:MAG: Gp15 family bacteriophage protein, partial [Acutalibacteraceae bacterium]|nr:Gp15 family bacteriophage protein [Acutalibacteraceae bacterium]
MIGLLPKSLEIDGREYEINSDFRVVLLIFEAY